MSYYMPCICFLNGKHISSCVVFLMFSVGNIPYEATEEQLKEIFCQAGPVVSFR